MDDLGLSLDQFGYSLHEYISHMTLAYPAKGHMHLRRMVDMVYFYVSVGENVDVDSFCDLTLKYAHKHPELMPLDGNVYDYFELAKWLGGDQTVALRYMALGVAVGAFDLFTPLEMPNHLGRQDAWRMVAQGQIAVQVR